MDPLATPAQLATRLGTATQAEADAGSTDILDTSRALDALASASGSIRAACFWPISRIVNDTLTVWDWVNWTIDLPTMHLVSATITAGAVPLVEGTDFTIRQSGLVKLLPTSPLTTQFSDGTASLQIVFTHGYNPVPDEVVDLCLQLAVDRYDNPGRRLSTTRAEVSDVFPRFIAPDGERAWIQSRLPDYVRPVAA